MTKLTHLDDSGAAHMVDVSGKAVTQREAKAEAVILLSGDAFAAVMAGTAPKGDVLAAARIAGIMAAKKVPELIPLCHAIALSKAAVEFEPLPDRNAIRIVATAATAAQTGVEMEALTAASVAALTLYDMIKAVDKAAVIDGIRLLAKSGGKSGDFVAPENRKEPGTRQASPAPAMRSSAGTREAQIERQPRVKPRTLMGEVSGLRLGADSQRDAFRKFMIAHRLQPTAWAREAGVASSEILGFLTGRSRGFSTEIAEKLAQVAKVRVEDLFR